MKISPATDKKIEKGAKIVFGVVAAGFIVAALNHGVKHGELSDSLKKVAPSERTAAAQERASSKSYTFD